MKRPLSVIGFTMLAALFVLNEVCNLWFTVALCGIFAFSAAVYSISKKKKAKLWILTSMITVCLSSIVFLIFQSAVFYPALKLVGENRQVEAYVCSYPTQNENRIYLEAEFQNGKHFKTKLRLSLPAGSGLNEQNDPMALKPGDTVKFKGRIYRLGGGRKSIENNFASKGLFVGAYPTGAFTFEQCKKVPLRFFVLKERRNVINQLRSLFDSDVSGIGISLLLGEKSFLSDEVYSAFKTAGVAHIFAVSGLHLGIWISFLSNVFSLMNLSKRKSSIFLSVVVLVVMAFSAFSQSVVRSGVMMLLLLLGNLVSKKSDSLNSLGLAAVIMLLPNPFAAMNVGFLLSFLSTLGITAAALPMIAFFEGKISKQKLPAVVQRILSIVCSGVLISFCAGVFTFAPCALYFSTVSLVSIPMNLVFLPITAPLIVIFGLCVMLYFVPVLCPCLCFVARQLSHFCVFVCKKASSLSFSSVSFGQIGAAVCCAAFCVFFVFLFLALKKKTRPFVISCCVCLACSFCLSFAANGLAESCLVALTVYDVPNGLCVSVSKDGKSDLFCARADDYRAKYILRKQNNLQTVVLTENDGKANESFLNAAQSVVFCNEDPLEFSWGKCVKMKDGLMLYVGSKSFFLGSGRVQNCDVLVTDDAQTALDNNQKCCIILSGASSLGSFVTTAENLDITIYISKSGKIFAKGENSWQNLMKKSFVHT